MSNLVYVPLADVSGACGLSEYKLLTHFWPAHWAVPRDWRMIPGRSVVLVAERALPDLVAALTEAGRVVEAKQLARWSMEIADGGKLIGAEENFAAGRGGTVGGNDFVNPHRTTAAPTPPSAPAGSWIKQWEDRSA